MRHSKELYLTTAISLACCFFGSGSSLSGQEENDATKENSNTQKQISMVLTNSIGMKFKPLKFGMKGATFTMGAAGEGHYPKRQVTLTKSYEIGVHEVTQEQYENVMGKNPSKFIGAQNPVEMVSWEDAVEFCRKLSELPEEKAAGRVYRLPTEAEWEYACRAGTTTEFSFGDKSFLGDYAWFDKNSGDKTHPVGQKKPNDWGLYDMHGNVWEWCQDYFEKPSSDPVTDPTGPKSGSRRVHRGGCWGNAAGYCRSSLRFNSVPTSSASSIGFRVARGPANQASKSSD